MIPMDVCHILLRRLWQYDKDSYHNGKKNTHTLWKDGVKIVLVPIKEDGSSESLLSMKEFLVTIKEAHFYYDLIAKKLEVEEVIISIAIAQLLREYEDVILEELPNGLPPKKDIQHHMDLILGSALPN